jgi:3-oxoacyl-[acyl-carrier protein] reductase
MRLRGKAAIVTGAGSGFGEAIARAYAREGASVVVNDISAAGGERVAAEINAAREGSPDAGRAVYAAGDVSRDADVRALVERCLAEFDRLDILVNNAGYTHRNRPMLEVSEEEFDRVYAVNVKAIYLAARHAVPAMAARGGGVILNTASTGGLRPRPGLTWYNGSKGAAVILTKSMAVELAPRKIRVNALCPVMGVTGLLEEFMGGEDTPERRAKFEATIPLGRLCQPPDVAAAALYLASDEAAFITGVALEIDGGRCV